MTPEERFTRMENLLQAMMEHQAKQQENIDKHTEQIKELTEQIRAQAAQTEKQNAAIEKQNAAIEKQNAAIEKQNAGIRDLIVVSRTFLNSIQEFAEVQRKDHEEWSDQMKELRAAQATTDEKLNILIHTVDRIVRGRESRE